MTSQSEEKKREPWTTTLGVWSPTIVVFLGYLVTIGMMKSDWQRFPILESNVTDLKVSVSALKATTEQQYISLSTRLSNIEGALREQGKR